MLLRSEMAKKDSKALPYAVDQHYLGSRRAVCCVYDKQSEGRLAVLLRIPGLEKSLMDAEQDYANCF